MRWRDEKNRQFGLKRDIDTDGGRSDLFIFTDSKTTNFRDSVEIIDSLQFFLPYREWRGLAKFARLKSKRLRGGNRDGLFLNEAEATIKRCRRQWLGGKWKKVKGHGVYG